MFMAYTSCFLLKHTKEIYSFEFFLIALCYHYTRQMMINDFVTKRSLKYLILLIPTKSTNDFEVIFLSWLQTVFRFTCSMRTITTMSRTRHDHNRSLSGCPARIKQFISIELSGYNVLFSIASVDQFIANRLIKR